MRNVVQITAGGVYSEGHSCALSETGGVRCWGQNDRGQLGDGTTTARALPVDVVGLQHGVRLVVAGGYSTCAVLQTNALKCWGENALGQLGDGSTDDRLVPTAVSGLGSGVGTVDVGNAHACAALLDGTVKCWGANLYGELGDGTTLQRLAPVDVGGLTGVVGVATSDRHTCALTGGGGVKCWGDNSLGQLGDGTNTARASPGDVTGLSSGVTAIVAGGDGPFPGHTCVITGGGAVKCWGSNGGGQLGNGTFDPSNVPVDVPGLSTVTRLSAGEAHTCATLATTQSMCWGYNAFGQLGDGTTFYRLFPFPVSGLDGPVIETAAGSDHTCALIDGGSVRCWGLNESGQTGDGTFAQFVGPTPVSGLASGMVDVSAGSAHTCGLTSGGGVKCWGSNFSGELGDGTGQSRIVPVDVQGLSRDVVEVQVGKRYSSCALTAAAGVKCWGRGQVVPTDVEGVTTGVLQLAIGYSHGCALRQGGSVRCWGDNAAGQLGDGSVAGSSAAVDVVGLGSGVRAVSSESFRSCALLGAGTVRCWGSRAAGPGTSDQTTPATISGSLGTVATLIAGLNQTCALTSAGDLYCWDWVFQTQPPSLMASGVAQATIGGSHMCALRTAGDVLCWGFNNSGQLGDGSTTYRSEPVPVSGLANIVSISAGDEHTCAVHSSGATTCWGSDAIGQIGNGPRDPRIPSPVLVDAGSSTSITNGNGSSQRIGSDASGRLLVFESDASSLVGGDTNGHRDIFLRDTQSNAIERISVDNAGAQLAADSLEPAVSGSGDLVVFVAPDAAVTKLWGESKSAAAVRTKSGAHGVFLRNLLTRTTQYIGQAMPSGVGTKPTLSGNGNFVVWSGVNADMANGVFGQRNIFMMPLMRSGNAVLVGSASCLSCRTLGPFNKTTLVADGESRSADVSADGRYVVVETTARNLVPGEPSSCQGASAEIILLDLLQRSAQRISPPSGVAQCGSDGATQPSIDAAGVNVAYQTDAPVDPLDRNLQTDVYVYTGTTTTSTRASENSQRHDGLGASVEPEISGDGKSVVFRSSARNLDIVDADNNEADDIFVQRLDQARLSRISRNARGDQANAISRRPVLNHDGTLIAFDSDADNLLIDMSNGQSIDTNGATDVFQVRLTTRSADVVFENGFE